MWPLVEYTFRAHLQVDLEAVWRRRSGRWFVSMLRGLLADETPLAHYFRPAKDDDEPRG